MRKYGNPAMNSGLPTFAGSRRGGPHHQAGVGPARGRGPGAALRVARVQDVQGRRSHRLRLAGEYSYIDASNRQQHCQRSSSGKLSGKHSKKF